MNSPSTAASTVSSERFEIPVAIGPGDIDRLGHVNNVVYVRWIQDAAVAHWKARATAEQQEQYLWVVVRHEIEYKRSAKEHDSILVRTWVGKAGDLTFERHTEVVRAGDQKVLATAMTVWCPVHPVTLKPVRVTADIRERFSTLKQDDAPTHYADRDFLVHVLAAIAYRTQKAIRDAPLPYWTFSPGNQVRTPIAVLRHMTSVLGYARTFMLGGDYPLRPEPLADIRAEVDRFHNILEDLGRLLRQGTPLNGITEKQLLQGPLSDVLTHAGQLALLRRLSGSPIPPENFLYADISPDRLGSDQAPPSRPDKEWPEKPD